MDIKAIRQEFPILTQKKKNYPLVYFDNAATTYIPKKVLDELYEYQLYHYASIHRSSYTLAEESSLIYEKSRQKIGNFINAKKKEIIITSGTTFGINLIAKSYAKYILKEKDEIIITKMEHHSNYIPWIEICKEKKAVLKIIPIHYNGDLELDTLDSFLSEKTKIISIAHISNVLGTINPIKKIIKKVKNYNSSIKVLIDGAQAVSHMPVNVKDLGCDFYVFSGHKTYAPTGVGILYIQEDILNAIPPFITGGGMVENISDFSIQYRNTPAKLEAGTPPILQVIGLAKSIDYLESIGMENIENHENFLLKKAENLLQEIKRLKILGQPEKRSSILSFYFEEIHPHDIATLLDEYSICIRSGQHCAQPLMDFYKIPGTNRISFGIYNTEEEIDHLIFALNRITKIFF